MSIPSFSLPPVAGSFPAHAEAAPACAAGKPAQARDSDVLDVLHITSTEQFFDDASRRFKQQALTAGVPMKAIAVEDLDGDCCEKKIEALQQKLRKLRESGKIDSHTQVLVNLHGSVDSGPHRLSVAGGEFQIDTFRLASVIRQALGEPAQQGGGKDWDGSVHISACGIARAGQDLAGGAGWNFLHGGRKIKFNRDTEAVFAELLRKIGEYRKDPRANPFPSPKDFYIAAAAISGEKVSMVGNGKNFHIRSGFLPVPADLVRASVMDKLERSLMAKLAHGKTGNVEKIIQLLGPATRNIKSFSPLHFLAAHGDGDAEGKIRLLLQVGTDINDLGLSGETPVHAAVRAGNKPMIRLLTSLGANPGAKNRRGQSAMELAVGAEDMDIIELLVDAGGDVIEADKNGKSALGLAWEKNRMELVKKCIASFLSRLPEGKDFLSYFGHELLLELLYKGEGTLFLKVIRGLRDKNAGLKPMFRELEKKIKADLGSQENEDLNRFYLGTMVEAHIEHGDDMPDELRRFLKHLARNGGESYLKFLLSLPRFSEKWTKELGELSAGFKAKGLNDIARLFDAAVALKDDLSDRHDRDRFQLFMPDESGYTPFGKACRDNKLPEAMLLHEANGGAINYLADGRKSMLMVACESNATAVIPWLLKQGADASVRDDQGRSALDYAISAGHADAARLLRKHLEAVGGPSGAAQPQ